MNKRSKVFCVTSAMAAMTLSGCSGGGGGSVLPGGAGQIVFVSNRTGNGDLYIMNADGSNQTQLTDSPAFDTSPALSADRRSVVFESQRDDPNGDIYSLDIVTRQVQRLTTTPGNDFEPAVNPRTGDIAFISDGNQTPFDIFYMRRDGTNRHQVVHTPLGYLGSGSPSFSPDGKKIVYIRTLPDAGGGEVFSIGADGDSEAQVTVETCVSPSYSPDGRHLVVSSSRDGNQEIYVMDTNGTNMKRLTNNPAYDSAPKFSPDGEKIAFSSNRDGVFDIYEMNVDGTNAQRLTRGADVSALDWR